MFTLAKKTVIGWLCILGMVVYTLGELLSRSVTRQ